MRGEGSGNWPCLLCYWGREWKEQLGRVGRCQEKVGGETCGGVPLRRKGGCGNFSVSSLSPFAGTKTASVTWGLVRGRTGEWEWLQRECPPGFTWEGWVNARLWVGLTFESAMRSDVQSVWRFDWVVSAQKLETILTFPPHATPEEQHNWASIHSSSTWRHCSRLHYPINVFYSVKLDTLRYGDGGLLID